MDRKEFRHVLLQRLVEKSDPQRLHTTSLIISFLLSKRARLLRETILPFSNQQTRKCFTVNLKTLSLPSPGHAYPSVSRVKEIMLLLIFIFCFAVHKMIMSVP